MFPHFVVHLQRCGFVDANHHRFAGKSAIRKMPHDIFRHRLQPVITGEDVILLAQFLLKPLLLIRVQLRFFDDLVNILVQIGIHQVQFRRAVLVEKRHRRAVFHRLLKIVDGNVITKNLLCALLSGDQWRAGEGQEERLR